MYHFSPSGFNHHIALHQVFRGCKPLLANYTVVQSIRFHGEITTLDVREPRVPRESYTQDTVIGDEMVTTGAVNSKGVHDIRLGNQSWARCRYNSKGGVRG